MKKYYQLDEKLQSIKENTTGMLLTVRLLTLKKEIEKECMAQTITFFEKRVLLNQIPSSNKNI